MMSKIKSKYIFLILTLLTLFIGYILQSILNVDKLIFSTLGENLSNAELENLMDFQNKWEWVSYSIIPLFLLIKSLLITTALYIGTFFYGKIKVTFLQIWDAVLKSEFVFILVPLFKIIWFYFFQTTYTFEDIQYFFPLSALNIVGYKGLEPWLIYPFQVLNVFELAYWLILAYFIGKITETNMDRGLKIVASSYGSALLLWVMVIMFFTLNYS
jgi:positive regulator of sigma E activity